MRHAEYITYLANIRIQHAKHPLNPLLLLEPSVKNRPQLPHHALRVSSPPKLRIAEHAPNAMSRHLRDFPVLRDPGPLLQSLAAAQDFALVLGLSSVDEDPVLDAAILSQELVCEVVFTL